MSKVKVISFITKFITNFQEIWRSEMKRSAWDTRRVCVMLLAGDGRAERTGLDRIRQIAKDQIGYTKKFMHPSISWFLPHTLQVCPVRSWQTPKEGNGTKLHLFSRLQLKCLRNDPMFPHAWYRNTNPATLLALHSSLVLVLPISFLLHLSLLFPSLLHVLFLSLLTYVSRLPSIT